MNRTGFVRYLSIFLLGILIQNLSAQSSVNVGKGSYITINSGTGGSNISAGSRNGSLRGTGTFNWLPLVLDPVALAASSITQTSFTANWNSVSYSTGYLIDVATDVNFTNLVSGYSNLNVGNVTSYPVNSNLAAGTNYYFRVRAYDTDCTTDYSNVIQILTAPPNPVAADATNINNISFRANWNITSTATGYKLFVATNSGFAASDSVTGFWNKNVGNVLYYNITGLTGNTTYYYKIIAYNGNGSSDYSNSITAVTAPAAPDVTSATNLAQTSFSANWNLSLGATGYFLDVATNSSFAAGTLVSGYSNLNVGNVTTYSVNTNLTAGTEYFYRLRATNGSNASSNSGTINLITIPPNPVSVAAGNILTTSFGANWNASTGASKYYLDVSEDAGFSTFVSGWENVDVGNVTAYSVSTNIAGGKTYYYHVRSANASGTSGNSGSITVLTTPPDPVTIDAVSMTQTSFTAKWNAALSATNYFLDVASDNLFTNFVTGWNNVSVGNVISYSVNSNLAAGKTYYYRVRAMNATDTTVSSNVTSVLLISPNPVATAASSVAQTSFTANWNASEGAAKYYLDVATDNTFTSFVTGWENVDAGNNLSMNVNTNLTAATNYYFRVRSNNTSGTSDQSNVISLVTAPLPPVATAGSASSSSSFSANWTASASADGYLIDVSTDSNFGAGTFVTGYNGRDVGNVVTYSVASNLSPGTAYYYRIRAYNAGGSSSNSIVITYGTLPVAPINASASSVTSTGLTANWNSVSGASGYKLEISTNSGFTALVAGYDPKDVGNVLTYAVSGLTENTNYYYRIYAYNDYGTSNNSSYITTLTAPAAPTSDAATNMALTQFTANWQSSAGSTGYYLFVSSASDFSSHLSGYNGKDVGNVTSYLVTALSGGTTYYYRIKGYNAGGGSPYSADRTVLTLPPAPVSTAATGTTANAFNANWNSSTSATGYKLDVSTDIIFGAGNFVGLYENKDVGNVTSESITGLNAGTSYYYRVKAYNASGTDGNSSIITVVTIPAAPTEQAAGSVTSNSFISNWSASAGAAGYYLDVSTNSGFGAGTFVSGYNTLDVGNVTSFTVTGLNSSTQYYYRISAYNRAGTSSVSGTISPQTTAGIPKPPAVSPASAVLSTSFSANWSASVGAASYRLDVSTLSGFGTFVTGWEDVNVGAVTTYSVNSNLTAGTTYYYRIRAVNGSGTSSNSTTVTVLTVPDAPVSAAASAIANDGLTANWNSSTGATGYKLDLSTANDFSSFVSGYNNLDVGDVTSFAISGLVGGTTYYYRVKGYNTGGTSTNSGTITQATNADPAGTLNATAATSITSTGFNLNWNADAGATGYKIDVSTVSNFASYVGTYDHLDVLNVTTYPVTGLTGGTTYYYRVHAYNGGSTVSNSGNVSVLTLAAVPSTLSATSVGETYFTANWNSSTGTSGYYIDVATDNSFTTFVTGFNNKYVNNVTSYNVSGLSGGTNYYYQVRAKNQSGTSASSSYTGTITLPSEPGILTPTEIQSTSFKANWNTATGATGYKIDVSTTSDFTGTLLSYDNLDVNNVSSKNVTGLNSGTVYYYRVKAYNGSGTGSNSAYMSLTTAPAAPATLAATAITQYSFTANWGAVTGATKYFLDVSSTSGFDVGTFVSGFQNQDVGNSTSVFITGLSSGISYYYRVRSFNSNGASSDSDTRTVLTIPSDPVIATATNVQTTSFRANWNLSTGATKYYIDVATDAAFTSPVLNWSDVDAGANSYIDVNTNLTANSNYFYRVRAENSSGLSNNSGYSSVMTGTSAPVATNASSFGETNFTANWNASAGADSYKLDVSAASNFSSFLAGFDNKDIGSAASYTVAGLTSGSTYYYRVRSSLGGRASGNSNTITALTKPAAPAASAASSISNSAFTASWGTSTGTDNYYLEISTTPDFSSHIAGYNPYDASTGTSKSVTGLSANTIYYYRVSASNASGTGSVSNIVTLLTAPAPPVTSAASSITNASFKANWGASTGATGYRIDVSSASDFSSFVGVYNNYDAGNVVSLTISSVNGSTNYYYRVRSYNTSATSGNSNVTNLTTAVDPSGVPASAAATSLALSSFQANWNSVVGAAGYKIDVSTNVNFIAGTILAGYNDRDAGNSTNISVTGLSGGTNYYYRVRSYNASGTSSNSGTITALTIPAAPISSAATNLAETGFSANWNTSTGTTKYYLDVSSDAAFSAILTSYNNLDVSNVNTYAVSGLTGGATYYYRIRAFNASGTSSNSGTVTILTIPAVPTASAASSYSSAGFSANWGTVTGAGGYRLDVSTSSGFGAGTFVAGYENKDMSGAATAALASLSSGTNYYYRVRSYNASGTSASSLSITALTIPAAPVAAASSSVTETGFTSNWNTTTGAVKYYLDVSTDSTFGAGNFLAGYENKDVGNVASCVLSGLTASTKYYYRVRSNNSSGTSTNSNNISILTAPPAPVSLAATSSQESSFNANWNSSTGAAGYRLDVSTENNFITFETDFENKDVGNVTTYNVSGITPEKNHYYRVRAYNAGGISANSSVIKLIGIPRAVDASSITQTSFTANWKTIPDVLGYRIDVATSISFSAGTLVAGYSDRDVGNVATFTISGLSSTNSYYYRVRCYDASQTSSNSNIIIVKNTPPALSGIETSSVSYTEGESSRIITSSITINDLDNTNLAGAVIQITNNYKNDQDKLNFSNANGITGTWDQPTGKITLNGISSIANYQNALQSIGYTNSSVNPDISIRTISFTVNDGVNNSNTITRDLKVTPVNSAPVVDKIELSALVYRIKESRIAISDSVIFADVDGGSGGGATISITENYIAGEDSLILGGSGGISGSWDASSGTLTLTGSGSATDFQNAVRNVMYLNKSFTPNPNVRTVSITYSDGIDRSNTVYRRISFIQGNIAPVISGMETKILKYPLGSASMILSDSLNLSDQDGTYLYGAEVKFEEGFILTEDLLEVNSILSVSSIYNWGTGTLSLKGRSGIQNYESILKSVRYKNIKGSESSASLKKISFTIYDGIENSNKMIRILAVDGKITSVEQAESGIPTVFALHQNYPNPFNPATVIKFALPKGGRYNLSVYNLLGQLIEMISEEEYQPGYYRVKYDASRLSSGIYFYRLTGREVNIIRKMMLVK